MSPDLFLLQLTDSALPIGGYSNSYGFETWVQRGLLKNASAVASGIETLLTASIAPQDGVACSLAWRCQKEQDSDGFRRLNDYITASRWTTETRNASLNMGQRLNRLAAETGWLAAGSAASSLDERTHHCAAFGWLAGNAGVAHAQTVSAYLYAAVAGLVFACVRLIPLGHTDGQRILTRLRAKISAVTPACLETGLEDMGGFSPLYEWAAKEHESLYSRLFQS